MIQYADDLELRVNNPFALGYIFQFDNGDEDELSRIPITVPIGPGDRYYTTLDGDTLGTIAFESYQNSKWWWVIYDANMDLIFDPFVLDTAITLRIPDLNLVKIQ